MESNNEICGLKPNSKKYFWPWGSSSDPDAWHFWVFSLQANNNGRFYHPQFISTTSFYLPKSSLLSAYWKTVILPGLVRTNLLWEKPKHNKGEVKWAVWLLGENSFWFSFFFLWRIYKPGSSYCQALTPNTFSPQTQSP